MANEYMEISEKTLDDCITAACRKLSITSDKLDYEVVDQGSAGFMGFNARNAVIRARVRENEHGTAAATGDVLENVHTVKDDNSVSSAEKDDLSYLYGSEENSYYSETNADFSSYNHNYSGSDFTRTSGRGSSYGHSRSRRHDRSGRKYPSSPSEEHTPHAASVPKHADEPKVNFSDVQVAEFEQKSDAFLQPMFQAMGMTVEVTYQFDHEENILTVIFDGEDMGVLIGKRGQTLDSIQYLLSLVVNRGVTGYVHVKADTENYRARRQKTLENLARSMAAKVRRTHRSQALEPMNPYERRIIHSSLQGDRYVTTYSEGEDPYRHVVIAPKR